MQILTISRNRSDISDAVYPSSVLRLIYSMDKRIVDILPLDAPDYKKSEKAFEKVQQEITENIDGAVAISWFGSTAIPVFGKNILDVMLFVPQDKLEESSSRAQERLGFGYNQAINEKFKNRRYIFLQRKGNEVSDMPVNLHLTSNIIEFFLPLIFKNYLQKYPDEAKEYEKKKFEWRKEIESELGEHADEITARQAFTAKKSMYVLQVMNKAFLEQPEVKDMLNKMIVDRPELLEYYKSHELFSELG